MNKNQKTVIFLWVILTGALGAYTAYAAANARFSPNQYLLKQATIPPVVIWITITAMATALWWMFSVKKS